MLPLQTWHDDELHCVSPVSWPFAAGRPATARSRMIVTLVPLVHLALVHGTAVHLALVHGAAVHLAFVHGAAVHLAFVHGAAIHLAFVHGAAVHLAARRGAGVHLAAGFFVCGTTRKRPRGQLAGRRRAL